MTSDQGYKAVVEKILDGKHEPYAVASCNELGSITFSLNPKVWEEKDMPELGMYVMLSDVRKKRAGWRAYSARFMRPCDEQKEQRA